jgi:hypothetical protein
MTDPDRRLRRHLVIALVAKLAALGVLWWLFVRDAGVEVDAGRAANRIGVAAPSQGVQR